MNGSTEIYIPPISASFTICYFQLKKLEMIGFAQFYLINCAAIQKDFLFEQNQTVKKKSPKAPKQLFALLL